LQTLFYSVALVTSSFIYFRENELTVNNININIGDRNNNPSRVTQAQTVCEFGGNIQLVFQLGFHLGREKSRELREAANCCKVEKQAIY